MPLDTWYVVVTNLSESYRLVTGKNLNSKKHIAFFLKKSILRNEILWTPGILFSKPSKPGREISDDLLLLFVPQSPKRVEKPFFPKKLSSQVFSGHVKISFAKVTEICSQVWKFQWNLCSNSEKKIEKLQKISRKLVLVLFFFRQWNAFFTTLPRLCRQGSGSFSSQSRKIILTNKNFSEN